MHVFLLNNVSLGRFSIVVLDLSEFQIMFKYHKQWMPCFKTIKNEIQQKKKLKC